MYCINGRHVSYESALHWIDDVFTISHNHWSTIRSTILRVGLTSLTDLYVKQLCNKRFPLRRILYSLNELAAVGHALLFDLSKNVGFIAIREFSRMHLGYPPLVFSSWWLQQLFLCNWRMWLGHASVGQSAELQRWDLFKALSPLLKNLVASNLPDLSLSCLKRLISSDAAAPARVGRYV